MNFELKKWKFDYVNDVVKFAYDKRISDNIFNTISCPISYEEAKYYVRQRVLNNEKKQACRAIVSDGHVIGGIDILIGDGIYSKSAEMILWVTEEYYDKGIGLEAIKQMCNYVFKKYDIIRIYVKLQPNNGDFIGVLAKVGFKHEGTMEKAIYKNGNYYDYCIYALLKSKAINEQIC